MPLADDRRELETRNVSPNQSALGRQQNLAIISANNKSNEISLYQDLDASLDFIWGNYYGDDNPPISYFDYYFTGQDVKINIEGTSAASITDPTASPFVECSYSIQQQKTPLYGFWSYSFDAVMRGTRIVSGMFRIVTTYPNRMTDLLAEAATTRKNKQGQLGTIRGLDLDEAHIEKYWDRNLERKDSAAPKRIFSVHPPFNLRIEYGIQSASIGPSPVEKHNTTVNQYKTNTALYTNTNERLVKSGIDKHYMAMLLSNVELTGMQTEFSPDGQVCSEVYSFFAKDVINL